MEELTKKILPTEVQGLEIHVTLYRLGNGVLATIETKYPSSVSSFETKHFGVTKRSVTIEQNVKRACKHYNFTKDETNKVLEMLK